MTDEARLLGTILDALEQAAETGDTYLPYLKLRWMLVERLEVTTKRAAEAIADAAHRGFVVLRGAGVYLTRLDAAEQLVADRIAGLLRAAAS